MTMRDSFILLFLLLKASELKADTGKGYTLFTYT